MITTSYGPGFLGVTATIGALGGFVAIIDFGYGQALFNNLTLPAERLSPKMNTAQNTIVAKIFKLVLVLSMSLFGVFAFVYSLFSARLNTPLIENKELKYAILTSLLLSCMTVPLSLSFKILAAKSHFRKLLLIQGMYPIFSLFIILLVSIWPEHVRFLVLVNTSLILFLISLVAFISSGAPTALAVKITTREILGSAKQFKSIAFWSLLGTISMTFFTFLPRYITSRSSNPSSIFHLTYILIFLASGQSVVLAYVMKFVTEYRNSTDKSFSSVLRATANCFLISTFLSLGVAILIPFTSLMPFRFLTFNEFLAFLFMFSSWSIFVIPYTCQVSPHQVRATTLLIIFSGSLSMLLLKLHGESDLRGVLINYNFPFYIITTLIILLLTIKWAHVQLFNELLSAMSKLHIPPLMRVIMIRLFRKIS